MKTLTLIVALVTSALADRTVTFVWDATPDADSYTLYINGVPAGSTTATEITVQIPDGRTNANVTGVNIAGESDMSDTLVVPPAPKTPKGFRISKIIRTTISTPK